MRHSESLDKLAEALAKAQGSITNPQTNKTVTIKPRERQPYTYNYADLGACIDAAKPHLAANGLSTPTTLTYPPVGQQGGQPMLEMMLLHTSGQFMISEYPLPKNAADKDLAAAMTYGKRYLFCALVFMASDDDVDSGDKDGDADIQGKGKAIPPKGAPAVQGPKPPQWKVSSVEMDHLKKLAHDADLSGKQVLGIAGKKIETLNEVEYQKVCATIREKILEKQNVVGIDSKKPTVQDQGVNEDPNTFENFK
jgi:hypothetical protein